MLPGDRRNVKLPSITGLILLLPLGVAPVAPAAADLAALVQTCEKCHGVDGISTTPDVPIIAGFSHDGFLSTMEAFRDGERVAPEYHQPGDPETTMAEIARALSEEELRGLADHFSQRPFKAAAQAVDPELARRGEGIHKQLCEKCHTDNGAHPVEDAAILAGQWTPYLRRQFANVLSGKREVPQVMLRRIEALKEQHIEALLNFYAETGLQRAQQ